MHSDYEQLFETWLGAFRHEFKRDKEWCDSAEMEYRRRIEDAASALGADHPLTASHTANLARLLHEQGKFREAAPIYQLAIRRFQAGSTNDLEMISWLSDELGPCMNHCPPSIRPRG